ncbi:VOC family protein [Kitasatospora sp. NPDC052896]|uniref:VOC family protein n=1 Tax=Kitasatospora sp. NPDC052896 TaxID=3364061 RepID=UPI0037C6D630
MTIELNHTIVLSRDKRASAEFLASTLGLEVGAPTGPFLPVATGNGVTLDFADSQQPITPQHYAFLVSEEEFDVIFARIQQAEITYYAQPTLEGRGEINHREGGRGTYFLDPNGHYLEILTRAHGTGSGAKAAA